MKRRYPRLSGPRFATRYEDRQRCYVCWPPGPRLAGMTVNAGSPYEGLDAWIPSTNEPGPMFGIDRALYPLQGVDAKEKSAAEAIDAALERLRRSF